MCVYIYIYIYIYIYQRCAKPDRATRFYAKPHKNETQPRSLKQNRRRQNISKTTTKNIISNIKTHIIQQHKSIGCKHFESGKGRERRRGETRMEKRDGQDRTREGRKKGKGQAKPPFMRMTFIHSPLFWLRSGMYYTRLQYAASTSPLMGVIPSCRDRRMRRSGLHASAATLCGTLRAFCALHDAV